MSDLHGFQSFMAESKTVAGRRRQEEESRSRLAHLGATDDREEEDTEEDE